MADTDEPEEGYIIAVRIAPLVALPIGVAIAAAQACARRLNRWIGGVAIITVEADRRPPQEGSDGG